MSNPFPGMNPWLEDSAQWSGFHHLLITATTEELQPQLQPRGYYALPGERIWLTQPGRPIYPDVTVSQVRSGGDGSAQALVEVDEPVRIAAADVEICEPFIEVYDAAGHRLVTGIEYISPSNKSDAEGRRLYRQKQAETRTAGIHLVEVDLIRRGPHILEVPESSLERLERWDYLVNLARRTSNMYDVYPIRLRDRLPRIRVPLKEGDEDAVLDIQAAFDRAWRMGPYSLRLDYSSGPSTPLAEDDARWAHDLVQASGS